MFDRGTNGRSDGASNGFRSNGHSGGGRGGFGGDRRDSRGGGSGGGFRNGSSSGGFRNGDSGGFRNGGNRDSNRGKDWDFGEPVSKKECNFQVVKNYYDGSTGNATTRPDSEIRKFCEENMVAVSGTDKVKPFIEFSDYDWPSIVYQLFKRNNYERPTPIQAQCWPIILSGRDLVGIAVTGSGKTMAFVLPAFIHIEMQKTRKANGPMVLVMAPTRELALQIEQVVNEFSYISSVCVYGGAPRGAQIGRIRRERPNIIIATPGRLIDLVSEGSLDVSNVSYVVLDEADRMLDMGFEPQIRRVFDHIPCKERQTLMFSATWPKEVRTLAADFTTNPLQVKIGSTELQANKNITQVIEVVEQGEKLDKLFERLEKIMATKEKKTIIFTDMKRKVDYLQKMITAQRHRVAGIHGDKSQSQRETILRGFRQGRYDILIATDVAARGLDVDDVKYVINFDFPNQTEDYIHRIGRTGRRENKGFAYTYFTSDDSKQAKELVSVLRQTEQDVPSKLESMAMRNSGGGGGGYNRNSRFGTFNRKRGGFGDSDRSHNKRTRFN